MQKLKNWVKSGKLSQVISLAFSHQKCKISHRDVWTPKKWKKMKIEEDARQQKAKNLLLMFAKVNLGVNNSSHQMEK